MTVDLTKLAFSSEYPIDKIVQEGEVTVVNDGNTTATTGAQSAKIVTSTTTNNYGKAVLARARWSIDSGVSWNDIDARLMFEYTDSGFTLYGLRAAISIGCSSTSVHFRTANGYHGNVSGGAYTPTSQTFIIQYVLFEDVPT